MERVRLFSAGLILALSLGLAAEAKDALVLYDGTKEKSEAFKSARYTANLLDHFSSIGQTAVRALDDIPPELVRGKDFIFIVCEEGQASASAGLLAELAAYPGQIIWIGMHVDKLLEAAPGRWGFALVDFVSSPSWTVRYNGTEFSKEDPELSHVRILDPANTPVLASAQDGRGRSYPYVLRSRNLWYFADSPFSYALESGRFLILADLLHDIVGEDHAGQRQALVRIEDVNPESKPRSLKALADYLYRAGVPFQVSLIPIFKNPEDQYELTLSDRPEVVQALRHMVRRGGTIVLHGATHQSRGLSADDYEFWDDIAGVPISHESPDWIDERIKRALDECFANGLYPLAWETPHYSASQSTYRTIARYFNTFNDRIMAAEISGTQQILPYPVRLKSLGINLVPENLGYVRIENPDPAEIVAAAKKMLAVRDGMASFFFHPFVPRRHLKHIIRSMKSLGWTFISLRDFPCSLRTETRWATSAGGQGTIPLAHQYFRETKIDRSGRLLQEDVSASRATGTITKSVDLPKGSLYVLEALDLLPPKKEADSVWTRLGKLTRIFKKDKKSPGTTLPGITLLTAEKPSEPEANSQSGYESAFRVFGFRVSLLPSDRLTQAALTRTTLLVVPQGAAGRLSSGQIGVVLEFVEKGGQLITEGKTVLAQKLGMAFDATTTSVAAVKELSVPAANLTWDPPVDLNTFSAGEAIILSKDAASGQPVAVIKSVGRGKVLFLAALLDPWSSFGISRYPYFPYYLKNFLGVPFLVRNNSLEYYFDPGLRQNVSWEKLVRRWQESGIKVVYLAAWHFYRTYRFDYRYFIKLCHDSGIAVYAWFEFPQVTPLLWEDHPEWREKTATGRDGRPHWRYLMNLAHPDARRAAKDFMRQLLTEHDWDGVNLAELNYDTNQGARDPGQFTPMNRDVRKAFQQSGGFDPLELFRPGSSRYWKSNPAAFQAFLDFRKGLVRDLHADFLADIFQVREAKGKDLEVIVTTMDSLHHPEIVEDCGVDTLDIIALMDRFAFTLQVEDPARSWTGPPDRYQKYYETYRRYIRDDRRLMFDINVIAQRDIRGLHLPSATPGGLELATELYYALKPSGRAGIYAESTAHPYDVDILPFVAKAETEIEQERGRWTITAGRPLTLLLDHPSRVPTVDGQPWPFFGEDGIFIPDGRHTLEFKKVKPLSLQALAHRLTLEAEISDYSRQGQVIRLRYRSPVPVPLTFSRPLDAVRLDAADLPLPPDANRILLPRGEHTLKIDLESGPAYAVDVVGYLSSSVFYVIGLLSVGLLFGLYLTARKKM